MAKRILVILSNGFEETEYVGTRDALIRSGIDVESVSLEEGLEIRSNHKLIIKADKMFENINTKDYDALFVPGGPGTNKLDLNEKFDLILKDFVETNRVISAICAAPSLLAKRGLLVDIDAVVYPDDELISELIKGRANYKSNLNYVGSGRFFTGKNMQVSVEFGYELAKFLDKR